MLFTYDFTDLESATGVISNLQTRLLDALETERATISRTWNAEDEEASLSLQQLKSHIFLLSEELNLFFEAMKLAQDRSDDQTDRKSALLLHASSREISWRMLDEESKLLSKLVVASINFHWLSRQDSTRVSHLTIGNLSAFDGSRNAIWSDILSKHNEPANHPLLKVSLKIKSLFSLDTYTWCLIAWFILDCGLDYPTASWWNQYIRSVRVKPSSFKTSTECESWPTVHGICLAFSQRQKR
jgi:hypothetical protein